MQPRSAAVDPAVPVRTQLRRDPELLLALEEVVQGYLEPIEELQIVGDDGDTFGWSQPVMLPSKKKAAAAVAAAAAVVPVAPSGRD